ncbi:MAG: hypothetical protein NVSMB4_11190 [Acidimicrobiales bacterium]
MTSALLDARPAFPEPGSPGERIVDATLRCVARWGLTKTTVDDVAREAGVGRATLYRLFPGGRDAVIDAVVTVEAARFFHRLDRRVVGVGSLEDLLVEIITEAFSTLGSHEALRFLFAHEPEAILPHLTFGQMDAVLASAAPVVAPYLRPWLTGPDAEEAAARGAEWLTRIVLSYLMSPSASVNLSDAAAARHLVRTFILPGLAPGQSNSTGQSNPTRPSNPTATTPEGEQ